MPYDSHRSCMKQANTKRRAPRVHSVTEEPPIACFHPVEILLLYPTSSFSAVTGVRPSPEHPEYRSIESCAIVTTTPNELLKDVHDRMPVILHPNHYHAWLTAPGLKSHHFAHILVPYDAEQMRRYPVSSLVNSPENDIPACVVEVPELASAQGGLFG